MTPSSLAPSSTPLLCCQALLGVHFCSAASRRAIDNSARTHPWTDIWTVSTLDTRVSATVMLIQTLCCEVLFAGQMTYMQA